MQREQPLEEQAAKQARQHPHMQEEPWATGNPTGAVRRQTPAGDDHVDMGMVGQRRAPGVQDAGHADPCAEALGVGRDRHHRLGGRLEQQVVHRLLVPVGDAGDLGRQSEDDVEVLHRKQVLGARGHPVARRRSLARCAGGALSARRAVPVLAGVVGDVLVAALGAARHMPAERLGPAGLDRRHHLELGQADMPGTGPPPRGAVGAEDVSDLQPWPGHAPPGVMALRIGAPGPAVLSYARRG